MDGLGEACEFAVLDRAFTATQDDGFLIQSVFPLIVTLACMVQADVLAYAAGYGRSLVVLAVCIAAWLFESTGDAGAAG